MLRVTATCIWLCQVCNLKGFLSVNYPLPAQWSAVLWHVQWVFTHSVYSKLSSFVTATLFVKRDTRHQIVFPLFVWHYIGCNVHFDIFCFSTQQSICSDTVFGSTAEDTLTKVICRFCHSILYFQNARIFAVHAWM
jgi:hypothetical protein